MTRPEGAFHRAARPLYLWLGLVLASVAIVGLGWFLFRVGNAIATAYERAAESGQAVPNMDGGLPALLTAVGAFLASAGPFIWRALTDRHRERMDQQARGTAPNSPFAPSPPSEPPFEGVNPHGGPNAP